MKILIAGSDEVWSLEKHYYRYFQEAGVNVQILPVQSIFLGYYNKSILNKIFFKAGLSQISRVIASQLQQKVLDWKPDVMWVFKGMEMSPEILGWTQKQGVKLVNYNPDNPFLFSGRGSGNKNVTDSISLYDLHFTYDRGIAKRLEQEFNKAVKILPFGFELSEALFRECQQQPEVEKACFLGNPDNYRAQFLMQLAKEIPIDVFGEGWSKFVDHPNITAHAAVYADDFWKILRRYRVQLNLMRPHNPDSHNMRSFEVPGVGGIGLFPNTPDHASYFKEDEEVFLYKNVEECAVLCKAILAKSSEEANKIRTAARNKSLQAGYSYRDRALYALNEISKLKA